MNRLLRTSPSFALSLTVSAWLAACGGGQPGDETASPDSSTYSVEVAGTDADAAVQAEPLFHAAPVLLDEPTGGDDANQAPHEQAVPEGLAQLSTRGLTVQGIDGAQRKLALSAPRALADGTAAPAATAAAVVTYSPAQIRAAYKLAALPAASATLTADQAAQLGAGQTIYIVNAKSNPNVAAELAAFNAKFGLPACTTKAIAVQTALPLAAAKASDGCTLSVVNASTTATLSTTVPPYDAGWATEIALDVQWAHATAPLARIVLIQAQDASLNSLVSAIQLANKTGPGVVSMSFGTAEGTWLASVDSAFTGTGMSYLAATGDWGTGVYWPAASAKVLAVGGTTLAYSGTGTRSETVWSGTGGGVSAQVALPAYQKLNVPGLASLASLGKRSVADVAFNANPSSGQYVAVQAPGAALKWISAGGTSLSTPQWAGLLAVANAIRARSSGALLGQPHSALYGSVGAVPGTYANAFGDVLSGSNGSCSVCAAKSGYDTPTGLGTPHGTALLAALAGSPAVAPAPAPAPTPTPTPAPVTGISITTTGFTGVAAKALTGSIAFNDPSNTAFSAQITGVPAGMAFTLSGRTLTATWAAPRTGNYTLNVSMRNAAGTTANKAVAVTVTAK